MPFRLRSMLHRALDIIADSGDAGGQGRRSAVRESGSGIPLPTFRLSGASGGVRFAAAVAGDVRFLPGGGAGESGQAGKIDRTRRNRTGIIRRCRC